MPRSLSSSLAICALLLALSPLHPFTPSPLQPLQAAEAKPAPRPGTNDDESKVPPYTLPDPLICRDGSLVTDAKTWNEKRRPELLELFKSQMHGHAPDKPEGLFFKIESDDTKALNGLATRLEIAIHLAQDADAPQIHLLLYIPNNAKAPVPVFISPNFDGNHSIDADPKITIREEWTWNGKEKRDALVRPAESTRGKSTGRWEVETIIKRGFALATFARNEVEPDYTEGWKHGIRGYYLRKSGKKEFAPDDWGAVAAWAWACSRALDYLETDKAIDAKHAIVLGHSRLGKAALWAGASDTRFACDFKRLRRRRRGPRAPLVRRNHRRHQPQFPALVLRQFQTIRRQRSCLALRSARTAGARRATPAVCGQRRRRPLVGSQRRISIRQIRRPGLQTLRKNRRQRRRPARRQHPRRRNHRLPHPHRKTRRHGLRLEPIPEFRRAAF